MRRVKKTVRGTVLATQGAGLSGGRNRNQQPCRLKASAARGLLGVDRLSRMTTVPGASIGASCVAIEVSNAVPFIAPLMTQGAVSAFCVSPAMNVCVPDLPKGALP